MDEKYVGSKIFYRNDIFGKGTIKEVVAYGFDERYSNFLKVIDYPFNKENINKRMVWFSDKQRKENQENFKQSGDWYVDGEISRREKKRLNKLLEEK